MAWAGTPSTGALAHSSSMARVLIDRMASRCALICWPGQVWPLRILLGVALNRGARRSNRLTSQRGKTTWSGGSLFRSGPTSSCVCWLGIDTEQPAGAKSGIVRKK